MPINSVDVLFDSSNVGVDPLITGTRSNPTFNLEPPIEDCVGVSVISADVPFTYYVVDSTNQWFGLMAGSPANLTNLASRRYWQLTPGTYTPFEFVQHFNQVGLSLGYTYAGTAYTTITYGMQCFFDNTDGKLVFSVVNTNTSGVNLGYSTSAAAGNRILLVNNTFADAGRGYPSNLNAVASARDVLGFTSQYGVFVTGNTTIRDNNETLLPSTGLHVKSDVAPKFAGPAQMYLQSTLGGNIHGSVRNQLSSRSLIAFWPVNAKYQGTIQMSRDKPIIIPFTKASVSKVQLSLALGTRTIYGASENTRTDYLQLNGEAFRIGIRFHIAQDEAKFMKDAQGNNALTMSSAAYDKFDNPSRGKI